ncbi:MAG: hypothetical protein H7256_08015 [Bdellovibrio sp.]|nr:hypothetical protein [Bdellovibrio sp.]
MIQVNSIQNEIGSTIVAKKVSVTAIVESILFYCVFGFSSTKATTFFAGW